MQTRVLFELETELKKLDELLALNHIFKIVLGNQIKKETLQQLMR
jgi:hypothetical protein